MTDDIEDYSTSRFLKFARDNSNVKDKSIQREKFTNLKKWIELKHNETRPPSESALGFLSEAFNTVDDIDTVEDDDVDFFMENVNDFFNQIEASDIETDDELRPYEIQALLSPNLLKLLGKSAPAESKASDWVAPQNSGLSNSSPILKNRINIAESKLESKSDDFKMGAKAVDISKVPSPYNAGKSEEKESSFTNVQEKEMYNNEKDTSDTGSEEESEYDYGDDDDDDDDALNNLSVSNMSPNLMAALGMDTSKVKVETDWVPPQTSGLQNEKLKSLTNFTNERK